MEQTIVQLIFENWKNLNRLDFDEFMLNQEATLIREEKEQIIDAIEENIFHTSNKTAEQYYQETFKQNK